MNDMAQSFLKRPLESNPAVDQALRNLGIPSWQDIRGTLEEDMTPNEREFRSNLEYGYGDGSPLHKLRLYSPNTKPEDDVAVTFYRDSASWCPYCQKVWIALEEKRIPYRVEKINMRCYGDKPREFLRLQPSGNIPVARIHGKVYGQSNDILYALEEDFPKHKSLRPPVEQQARAQSLLRLERELFSAWMHWLTGSASSKATFLEVLNRVEQELQKRGPFFLGDEITLVDVMFAPFLERMAASLCYYKGFVLRVPQGSATNFPGVNRWFTAMEGCPSYRLTKSDYYTHAWDLPPQLGGCTREADGAPYERAINGQGNAWQLPLEPNLGGIEPDWTWISTDEARRQAVERVTGNAQAIVSFAARGAGKPGMPPVVAPLADPNAEPSVPVMGAVDATMRLVCLAILHGVESQNERMSSTASTIVSKGDAAFSDGVLASLEYVRDRVGVPRDMTLPAARQLRAHLNWAINHIRNAKI